MLKYLLVFGLLEYGAAFPFQHIFSSDRYSCPIDLPLSCSNKSEIVDTCCFEAPGGILLQTQFWDYIPPRNVHDPDDIVKHLGPLDSFTNHGLWPDNCDGSYAQFCNSRLNIDDVWNLLNSEQFNNDKVAVNGTDLLDLMSMYWKSNTGDDESLWVHEYNKHGTCIQTIAEKCYSRWGFEGDFKKQAVYDYFRIAMELFNEKNSFQFLKAKNIVPSVDETYTKSQIEEALRDGHSGEEVFFLCDRHGVLNQIWYYHALQGSLLGQQFVPISPFSKRTNCPEQIKWYPKGHSPSGYKPPGSRPSPGTRGIVRVAGDGGGGFLIKNGHWYSKGSPAQYFLSEAPFGNYYLRTRMGYCGMNSGDSALACNKNIAQAAQFDYDSNKGYLGYSGSFDWHARKFPRGNSQVPVYPGRDDDDVLNFNLKFIKQ